MKYEYGIVVNFKFNGKLQFQVYNVVAENDSQALDYAVKCVRAILCPQGVKAEDIFASDFFPGSVRNNGPASESDAIAFAEHCKKIGVSL